MGGAGVVSNVVFLMMVLWSVMVPLAFVILVNLSKISAQVSELSGKVDGLFDKEEP